MKASLMFWSLLAAGSVLGFPAVTDVTLTGMGRRATIGFSLSETAIVTVSFETNGVALGGRSAWRVFGDVNKQLDAGAHQILWRPPDGVVLDAVKPVVTAWTTNQPPLYLAVDLQEGVNATRYPVRYFADAESVPGGVTSSTWKTSCLLLRKIPPTDAGGYQMGTSDWEANKAPNETPVTVFITKPFYMGVYEITEAQWLRIAANISNYRIKHGAERPRECQYGWMRGYTNGVRWPTVKEPDAVSGVGYLRTKTGLKFDLPTEGQWEYACRAGTREETQWDYRADGNAANYLWGNGNRWNDPDDRQYDHGHRVGHFPPNAWGLYDMEGNMWELCRDRYVEDRSQLANQVDPEGAPLEGHANIVIRGGSFCDGFLGYSLVEGNKILKGSTRPASRYPVPPEYMGYNVGARLVVELD